MRIVSRQTTATNLTEQDESGSVESTRTIEWVDLEDWIAALSRAHAIDASPYLAELLHVARNASHHHMRVVLQAASVGPHEQDVSELRARHEALIEQMTPELTAPSEPVVRQSRRNAEARTQLIQEFGALTGDQIGEEHSNAQNRHALAARWRKEGRIFGVPYRGQTLYPAFQFDMTSGEVRPTVKAVLEALPRDRMSAWECALWWTAANGLLNWRRPVDVLDEDPGGVIEAARRLGQPSGL